jgi:hypothetical protein
MGSKINLDQTIAERRLSELFNCAQFDPFRTPDIPTLPPIWKYDFLLNNTVYASGLKGMSFDNLCKTSAGAQLIDHLQKFKLSREDVIILEFGSIYAVLSCTFSDFGPSWIYIDQDDFEKCDLIELDKILAALAARKKRQMILGNLYGSDIGMIPPWATATTLSCTRLVSKAGFDPALEVKSLCKQQPLRRGGSGYIHRLYISGKAGRNMEGFECDLRGYWLKCYGRLNNLVTINQYTATRLWINQALPDAITIASSGRQVKELISFGSKYADHAFGICKILHAENEDPLEGGPSRTVFYLDDPIVTLAPMPKSVKEKADRLGLVTAHPLEPWWLT